MLSELPLELLRLLVNAAGSHPPHSITRERVWRTLELLMEGDVVDLPALHAALASLEQPPCVLHGAAEAREAWPAT